MVYSLIYPTIGIPKPLKGYLGLDQQNHCWPVYRTSSGAKKHRFDW